MQMHRVYELTNGNETQADQIPFLDGDGFGGREGLAVDREIVRLHPTHWHGSKCLPIDHAPFRDHQGLIHNGWIGIRFLRVNDERRVQPGANLHITFIMGVIHKGSCRLGSEFVGKRLARLDRVLGDTRDAVHCIGNLHTVPVDCGRIG